MSTPHPSDRPDPDVLLAKVRREETRAARGKLRIYFGANAGVGKTYAMLSEAKRRLAEGSHVLVGVVETHGRAETAALLLGPGKNLDVLPPRTVEHWGNRLTEFDLDLALARHPSLLVVDELAHSNAPGSRHPKRWQDVEELLAAGIDVFTALNVQHLESLSDVVSGITGIRVFESVPDHFFDNADEVVVIDVPPDEILKRLAAGQVYIAEQAERAAKNFFRKGNLLALREIALRRTADRVEEDVQTYRVEKSISTVWRTEGSLLCCVGPDPGAEHIVRSAARLAHRLDVPWTAAYVETPRLQRRESADRERILRTVRLAQELGAATVILSGSDPAAVLVDYARNGNFSKLVLGRPQKLHLWQPSVSRRIAQIGADIDLIEIARADPAKSSINGPTRSFTRLSWNESGNDPKTWQRLKALVQTTLVCGLTALLATPLLPHVSLTNIAMLFLMVVALVALKWGRGPAVLAAFLSVAEYDFFFVPPRMSFAVADLQYLVTFAVMLAVALIIGQLTAKLRYEARVAAHRERRARALYEFSRQLSSALLPEDVTQPSADAIAAAFRCEVAIMISDENDNLVVAPGTSPSADIDPALAQWTLRNGKPAGTGTDTLPSGRWLYLPLHASMRDRGVLAIKPSSRRLLMIPEQVRQLETFASLVAIALERVHYINVAQAAVVNIESERLRSSLLSALSHDLRTPLTVLMGLADSLSYVNPSLPEQVQETAREMRDEAHRMSALVENLLEMARIQSGQIQLKKAWIPFEEVVGTALHSIKNALRDHVILLDISPALPLVEMDPILIERVLVNLLENASKYSPPGSTVAIRASTEREHFRIAVEDNGPGLPPVFLREGHESDIFDKFTRGEKESATAGVGLGLAICKAIVEAHHGTIRAESTPGAGTSFIFTLPRGEPPSMDEEELQVAVDG